MIKEGAVKGESYSGEDKRISSVSEEKSKEKTGTSSKETPGPGAGPPTQPQQPNILSLCVSTICSTSDLLDDACQLSVTKSILTLITSHTVRIHEAR